MAVGAQGLGFSPYVFCRENVIHVQYGCIECEVRHVPMALRPNVRGFTNRSALN
jgi:hypothetical protein